jgi:drug/metabolite transporter (DMT)-like permease
MSQREVPIRGIALIAGATVLFAIADTTSKFLSTSLPIIEFIWFRYLLFLVMALLLVRRRPLGSRRPGLQLLRALGVVGSSVLFVFGIRQMTMAQATTISFLSPLLITILSIPLLGEQVGVRRWAAVLAGMLGMLIVVRPGTGGFQPAALFGVASSFCWSIALIITRKMAAIDPAQTTILCSAAVGVGVLSLLLPFEIAWPDGPQIRLMLVLGVLASVGQWMVVEAHRHAAASVLAPISYTQLIWVSVTGYLVFANLPDRWTVLGAAVIVASGLYTAHRERVRSPPPCPSRPETGLHPADRERMRSR